MPTLPIILLALGVLMFGLDACVVQTRINLDAAGKAFALAAVLAYVWH